MFDYFITDEVINIQKNGVTHIFIGGLVGADQVGVKSWQTYDGPDGEKAHHHFQNSAHVKDKINLYLY